MHRQTPTRIRRIARAAGILAATLLAAAAAPATPMLVGYQGAIFDAEGIPVEGPVAIEVSVYDAATGGSELYREAHASVDLVDGAFDVEIGGGSPIAGQFDAQTFQSDQTWLEIRVEGEVLGPRQRMVSVPYALRAAVAETVLGGVTVTDDLNLTGSGSQLGGAPLRIENTNATDGVAAVFKSQSSWETARIENTGGGEVLKLLGKGSALDDAVLRVENTTSGSNQWAARFKGRTTFEHVTSWSAPTVEVRGSGRWSTGAAVLVENVRTDEGGVAGRFISHTTHPTVQAVNDGPGEALEVSGKGATANEASLRVGNSNPSQGIAAYMSNTSDYATAHLQNHSTGEVLYLQNKASSNTGFGPGSGAFVTGVDESFDVKFWIDSTGMAHVRALEILGGADLSERFDVTELPEAPVEPGTVVSIDAENPGELAVSARAYDTAVAGIVAGAGGVEPGMLMAQRGDPMVDGEHPVALSGRVYAKADVSGGPIRPGDLLTTSERAGHAMRATDRERAGGAILGKAMTGLDDETGLVLVLVNLQ